jgi:hypothetical protein
MVSDFIRSHVSRSPEVGASPLTFSELKMMKRMIENREPFVRDDDLKSRLADLKADVAGGRFGTFDDYTTFSGILCAFDSDLTDSDPSLVSHCNVMGAIHDLDRKIKEANLDYMANSHSI